MRKNGQPVRSAWLGLAQSWQGPWAVPGPGTANGPAHLTTVIYYPSSPVHPQMSGDDSFEQSCTSQPSRHLMPPTTAALIGVNNPNKMGLA